MADFWKQALHIVQPDTLLRWYRDRFRRYWRWKSKPKQKRKQRISPETIALIKQMARENLNWGAKRIRIVQEYFEYFNTSRPHQGLDQQIPDWVANGSPWPVSLPESQEKIISTPVLGGLHQRYSWAAANPN